MKKCSVYLCILCSAVHLWLGHHLTSWVPVVLSEGRKIHGEQPPWAELLAHSWWPYGVVALCILGLCFLLCTRVRSSHIAYALVVLMLISTVLMFLFGAAVFECSQPPFSK